jgi:7-carboxy-7-deazaguanine synthase
MSIDEILMVIKGYGTNYVCITGGEPLLQSEIFQLMSTLCDQQYLVSLETSGSKLCHQVDSRVKIILDVKTPDSGAKDSFKMENLSSLRPSTELKFVICSEVDFNWAEEFCRQHSLFDQNQVFYSPSFGKTSPQWLAEKILFQKSKARLQLQLHKYIWAPDKRGV